MRFLPTLSGYTSIHKTAGGPGFRSDPRAFCEYLGAGESPKAGSITPQEAAQALACGAWAVTVGSAITRPAQHYRAFLSAVWRVQIRCRITTVPVRTHIILNGGFLCLTILLVPNGPGKDKRRKLSPLVIGIAVLILAGLIYNGLFRLCTEK